MTDLKLEVGKKYKVAGSNVIHEISKTLTTPDGYYLHCLDCPHLLYVPKSQINSISEHTEEPMNEIDNDLTPCCNAYWKVGNICSKCNKMVSNDAEEIKLEVGKKYDIKNAEDNPYIYVGNLEDYGFEGRAHPYIFIDNQGDIRVWTEECIEKITERRDKRTLYGYVYEEGFDAFSDDEFVSFYKLKTDAMEGMEKEPIYGRFTFEQLPEPEDK